MASSSREHFKTIIAQINLIESNHADKLRDIDSKFKEVRDAIQDELQKIEQRRQQMEQEHQIAIETEEQSYSKQLNPYLEIFSLPKQQDRETPEAANGRQEGDEFRDGNKNTEKEIIVVDSESESSTPQTAMGGLSDTPDDDVGTSEQPAPRNRRRRKRPAMTEHSDNDVQADTPQADTPRADIPRAKRARNGGPSNASFQPTFGVYTDSSHRSLANPYDIIEPPTPTSVRRENEVFKGITYPTVGEIYKVQDKRFSAGYAALILPLGDFDVIGISRSIRNTKIGRVPPCYRYDKQDRSFLGWRRDYEDDGSKVTDRKFACMCFHKGNAEIPLEGEFTAANEKFSWISAKTLRPLNLEAPASKFIGGWKRAKRFSQRLKLIREKHANGNRPVDTTIDVPAAEENETDGQIPRDTSNVTSTDELPSQLAVDDMPHDSLQAPESPSGRSEQNLPEEQSETRLPPQPQRDPWNLPTLEEINQQHPDPTSGELGYGSDGMLQFPQDDFPNEEDHKDTLGWFSKPLPHLSRNFSSVHLQLLMHKRILHLKP